MKKNKTIIYNSIREKSLRNVNNFLTHIMHCSIFSRFKVVHHCYTAPNRLQKLTYYTIHALQDIFSLQNSSALLQGGDQLTKFTAHTTTLPAKTNSLKRANF